jgi:hypothetical protein
MPNQFVWEEAPEHGLFALDKLQMPRQFIQDEALEHELFEGKLQMPKQFVQDEALEHKLFALDKLQKPRPIVQEGAAEDRCFNDELQIPRLFVQDEAPEHKLLALDTANFRCPGNSFRTKRLSICFLRVNSKCSTNSSRAKHPSMGLGCSKDEHQMPGQFVQDEALKHALFENKRQMLNQFV